MNPHTEKAPHPVEGVEQKFVEATARWYEFVGRDHHKDRDCHWYVGREEAFSYGQHAEVEAEPWFVKHYGYIEGDQTFYGKTRDHAMHKATNFIDECLRHPPTKL